MTTLCDETLRRQVGREARGTSGSTLKATSAGLGLLLLTYQAGSSLAVAPEKRVVGRETVGTGTEIVSLRITEQDLVAQLSRVYRALSSQQVELDAEASRVLYQNLWSLY